MGESGVLGFLLVLSVVESVLAVCGGKTVGVDASILTYRYLLRASGAAVALVKDGDPSVAKATFKEVLAYFHKFPINWIFYFDGTCEGKAALGARREQKRLTCYQKYMEDISNGDKAAAAAKRTPEL